ncbi:Structural maintenance of chromosomes protein 2 [Onygenales sp. PD_12]|nr:Structural maintenance of chromosomes protein 2 [Onygenales sp. PD_12]KAK2796364.1 Structural maintenance of chromosomes protein 2 [Onygenales sp. PD_10]
MVENQQQPAIVITWLFPAITTVLVGLRVYSRYLGHNFGWDDTLMGVAYVLVLVLSISTHEMAVISYAGYHKWDVPKQSIERQILGLKWSFVVQLVYHPLMGAIRGSIVMFLFRLQDLRKGVQIALHTVFWMNVGYTISTTLANVLTCIPISYSWTRPATDQIIDGEVIPGGKCFNTLVFILASCALSIFMDLIIMPIPTAMVWNLTMPRKTKIAVVIVMGLGWVATAISGVRFAVYYYRWDPNNTDRNYGIGFVVSIVEPNVGMWAACAPALKHLLRIRWPNLFSSVRSNGYQDPWSETPKVRTAQPWSRKRESSMDSIYRLGTLGNDNIDSASQEHIITRPSKSIANGSRNPGIDLQN